MTKPDQDSATPAGETRGAPRRGALPAVAVVVLATLAGALAGALALYGMNRLPGNASAPQTAAVPPAEPKAAGGTDAACAGTVARARSLDPFATGDLAALRLAEEPRRLPALAFADDRGEPVGLDRFRGRLLLVNLWATWCVPCREEMPALDALEKALGGADFQVVAINLDTRDPEKPKAFLSEIGVSNLRYYADPATKSFQALRSVGRGFGLPTTLLVDRDGCELGYLAGPAEWAGADAKALIAAALKLPAAETGQARAGQ